MSTIEIMIAIPTIIIALGFIACFLNIGDWEEKTTRIFILILCVVVLLSISIGSFKFLNSSTDGIVLVFEFDPIRSLEVFLMLLGILLIIAFTLNAIVMYDNNPLPLFGAISIIIAIALVLIKKKFLNVNSIVYLFTQNKEIIKALLGCSIICLLWWIVFMIFKAIYSNFNH